MWTLGVSAWTLGVSMWTLGVSAWALGVSVWTLGVSTWTLGVSVRTLAVSSWTLGVWSHLLLPEAAHGTAHLRLDAVAVAHPRARLCGKGGGGRGSVEGGQGFHPGLDRLAPSGSIQVRAAPIHTQR
eukprot:749517-Prorocentrum_minimum.AAC.1